jgi:hypothetical protein
MWVHSSFKHIPKTTSGVLVFKYEIHFVVSILTVLSQSQNITWTSNKIIHILPSSSF